MLRCATLAFSLMSPVLYTHMLEFDCPACGSRISAMRLFNEKNLEAVGAEMFHLKCPKCKEYCELRGASARKHVVKQWGKEPK